MKNNEKYIADQTKEKTDEKNDLDYFYFNLSKKNEVVMPSEKESSWEQLRDITWDPGRGD